nr:ras-related protein Rab-32 [Vicugna pacos]
MFSVLFKLTYGLSAIPTEVPAGVFVNTEMLMLRFIWKCKGIGMAITNLKKNCRMRGFDLPEKKAYNKATEIKSGAAAAAVPETREHLFKVLVIGELGVGKTSIIKRYVHQLFSQHYRATIGVDFALKVLNWDSRTLVRLQLWDIAGQERFGNMTRVYYKEAVGAFVVFDVSRGSTFEAVLKWKSDLDSKVHLPNGSPIPAVLLANKCDQRKDGGQNPPQMDQFCKEHGFSGWFETSAKDNINIDEAARFLVENILANHQSFPSEEIEGSIKLDPETLKKENKPQCC